MLLKLQHNLTNWVDGMKIGRQHFVDSESALLDGIRDTASIFSQVCNYGLLEALPGEKSSLDCDVISNGAGKPKIIVRHCRAITAGGCRIEILPGLHPELVSDADFGAGANDFAGGANGGSANYLAVILVDPFNRQPFGHAVAEEFPPRNQYSVSAYKLAIVPEDSIHSSSAGAYMLPVARFAARSGELVRDNNYIPPCAVIASFPGTKQLYNYVSERFNVIQEHCLEVVRKVADGGQTTALALNTKRICEECAWYISGEFFAFRTIYRRQSPVYIGKCVVQLANIVSLCINVIPSKEKEELLQYFSHWNDVSPGKFEDALSAVTDSDYDHDDLAGFFQPLLSFLKMWSDLLEKLKDLKLIGARKEGFDLAPLSRDTQKEEKKGKFRIFD